MKKTENGFSLLEAAFAILLFAILVQMLMNFFYTMYVNGKYFQKQSNLMDNARAVNAFVKEKIREADKVKITVEDVSGAEKDFDPVTCAADNVDFSGRLIRIKFQDDANCSVIEMKAGSDPDKGNYILNYVTYDSPTSTTGKTPVLISDEVESIMVEHKKDTDEISFKCSYAPKNPTDKKRETVTDNFSESLAYKQKIG